MMFCSALGFQKAKKNGVGRGLFLVVLVSLSTCQSPRSGADDWPQWRGPNRDGVWNDDSVLDRFANRKIAEKWSVDISSGYSGPAVADGRVFITDRKTEPRQVERVFCFSESNGQLIWSHEYDCEYREVGYKAGPRATVTVDGATAFSLGTMGDIHAFNAATGEVLWHRQLQNDFAIKMPIWGIAAAPLVYDDKVILQIGGSDGACVVALEKETGKEVWRSLDDRASYSAPIIIQQAGRDVLVVWTGDNVAGLDPQSGRLHWASPMQPVQMVIGIATPVVEGNRIFVTSFYDGSKMVEFAQDHLIAKELWRARGQNEKNTEALHSIISTPLMFGGHIYGVDSYGELRCLRANDGRRIWEDLTATPRARWSNIHMVKNGEKVWMFNERGELIIGQLSPQGFTELSRAQLIEPTREQLNRRDGVCWAHPAFANGHVFVRNDKRLLCADLRRSSVNAEAAENGFKASRDE